MWKAVAFYQVLQGKASTIEILKTNASSFQVQTVAKSLDSFQVQRVMVHSGVL